MMPSSQRNSNVPVDFQFESQTASFVAGCRRGYTLIEVLIAISVSAILLLALASVVKISLKTLTLSDGPAARTSESTRLLTQVSADLELAMLFSERTANSVTFTVPDRDGDSLPETIRYALDASTQELVQTITFSDDAEAPATKILATNVEQFDLGYLISTAGTDPISESLQSSEVLLASHIDRPPTGSANLLLIVGDVGSLTAQEASRKSLIESFGFSVNLIDEEDTQENFDIAAAMNDVAYISEQVNETLLGTKLTNATLGIVNEKIELAGTLGFGVMSSETDSLRIVDMQNSKHYVTRNLSPGGVVLFNSKQPVGSFSGSASERAPEFDSLANWKTSPALACFDVDDELYTNNSGGSGGSGGSGIFGFDILFGNSSSPYAFDDIHVATKVSLPTGGKVSNISAYINNFVPVDIRYGIYADENGEPGELIVQTEMKPIPSYYSYGWHTIDLEELTVLPPGDYWLAISHKLLMSMQFETFGGQTRMADDGNDPSEGFMNPWNNTVYSGTEKVSIKAGYEPVSFASSRRVQLPWGDSGFDIDSLSMEANLLLRDSLYWAADPSPNDTSTTATISSDSWAAQYFQPTLPGNATAWSVSRVVVRLRNNPDYSEGRFRFGLYEADLGGGSGFSQLQQTDLIEPSVIGSDGEFIWYEIPFLESKQLPKSKGVFIVVVANGYDVVGEVSIDANGSGQTANTFLIRTDNSGATWTSPSSNEDMRFQVYGKVYTNGP